MQNRESSIGSDAETVNERYRGCQSPTVRLYARCGSEADQPLFEGWIRLWRPSQQCHHNNARVKSLHPPIDSQLLNELYKQNVGDLNREMDDSSPSRSTARLLFPAGLDTGLQRQGPHLWSA